jgi:hypothetical protein
MPGGTIAAKPDGSIVVDAEKEDECTRLKLIALIAARYSSSWGRRAFILPEAPCVNLETGKATQGGIVTDVPALKPPTEPEFRDALAKLSSLDEQSLLFLARSSDFARDYAEVCALVALEALEIKLNQVVYTDEYWPPSEKIRVLRRKLNKGNDKKAKRELDCIQGLFSIRNRLAHGDWTASSLEKALKNLFPKSVRSYISSSNNEMSLFISRL